MVFLLTAVLILLGCAGTKIYENISIQEAVELIENNKNNPDFTILDVRTLNEYETGHIQGAINLDFNAATFRDELDKLNKKNPCLVYCQSAIRSGQAMRIMESLGFKEVYNLSGGITDWIAGGLPVVK